MIENPNAGPLFIILLCCGLTTILAFIGMISVIVDALLAPGRKVEEDRYRLDFQIAEQRARCMAREGRMLVEAEDAAAKAKGDDLPPPDEIERILEDETEA